jgi:stalled ribosome alternative rescue factor ArfA
VVQKKYKGSLQREEVVVQWKKAFESSKKSTSEPSGAPSPAEP